MKSAHLANLNANTLIDQVCIQGERKKVARGSGVSATPASNVMALRKKSQFPT
jgi:hypothetical protein